MRGVALVLALLLPVVALAQPQPSDEPVDIDTLLPDSREVFRIGFAELTTTTLPPERRFVAATFPLLLYDELRTIDSRVLTVAERNAYLDARIDAARLSAARALTAAVDDRDALLFSEQATPARRADARQDVITARAEFEALAVADRTVDEPHSRPVAFSDDLESGLLLSPVSFAEGRTPGEAALAQITEEQDLDYLVFGLAEQRAGYTIVDVYGYHRFLGRVEPLARTTRLVEEVGRDAREVADEMAAALLGRQWVELTVRTARPDAAIRVNGELAGFGGATVRYAEAGRYTVEGSVPGFVSAFDEVTVEPGERVVVTLEMSETEGRTVTLRSSPAAADVYVDSLWVGRTPLVHTFSAASSVVHMRREGFLESRFVVDAGSPQVISRALLSDQIDWTEELREQRDEFYDSLGYFVLSVPVTVLLWGGYQNVLGTRASPDLLLLPPEDDERLVQIGNTLYWSALGGFAVNAGLFINVILNLLDYVAVGEGAHNQ